MTNRIRIGIVDDHPMMREGIALTLSRESDFQVVAQGATANDAVSIARNFSPALMLLDIAMPGSGLFAARSIRAAYPEVRLVFLTVSENHDDVSAALNSGVAGYILKGISGPDLVRTLRSVSSGESYVTPQLASRLLGFAGKPSSSAHVIRNLSLREEQILQGVSKGLKNKEIAVQLNITEKTVKHYMSVILSKLNARNRVEALVAMQRLAE